MNSDTTNASNGGRRPSMTDEESKARRASIQAIMKDPTLSAQERRKSIQSLMDGRRRSSQGRRQSGASGMAAAAALAAAEFADLDSSDEEDMSNNNMHSSETANGEVQKTESPTKRSSTQILSTDEAPTKRRTSLRESFTMGFSNMGVLESSGDTESSTTTTAGGDNNISPDISRNKTMEKSRPICEHYERNCSIVSPCCGLVFGCRICHDESPELPPPFLLTSGLPYAGNGICHSTDTVAASMPVDAKMDSKPPPISHRSASLPGNFEEEESHHEIDRFLIKEVICRECFARQSSKTNNCINCDAQFGTYHCSTCNLWMSADEEPYHCLKCGFCRVGGRENFTHCDDCGMCIDALLFEDHNCKSGKYMSNCPVCQEDLFSSRMASHEMPCGHAIHWHCFRELTSHDTRCPVCKKTAETHDQMTETWNAMAMGIALQPVPPDMARVVDILCNDCEHKGENQRWHFLGVQCRRCTSFNTTVERTVLVGQEANDFLGPPTDLAHQAQLANGMGGANNRDVLTALMGGGNMGDNEDMDETEANQSVAAEVMGIMNRTANNHQPFSNGGSSGVGESEMDQS